MFEKFIKKYTEFREKRLVRMFTNKYFVVTFVFLLMGGIISNYGLLKWAQAKIFILKQETIINNYNENILDVENKLKELTSNKDSLEKFAREQYYFHAPDEVVFIVRD